MSRPFKCRRVAFVPGVPYFKPAGIHLRSLKEVRLSVEEVEALHLKELKGLEQEQGAEWPRRGQSHKMYFLPEEGDKMAGFNFYSSDFMWLIIKAMRP